MNVYKYAYAAIGKKQRPDKATQIMIQATTECFRFDVGAEVLVTDTR